MSIPEEIKERKTESSTLPFIKVVELEDGKEITIELPKYKSL